MLMNDIAVNRLDRLTSGLLIFPLTSAFASTLSEEFRAGTVRKEYVARVKGEFPMYVFLALSKNEDDRELMGYAEVKWRAMHPSSQLTSKLG